MKVQVIGVMAACLALAACGSKKSEEPAASPATQVAPGTVVSAAPAPASIKPAPEGLPSRVAREVITSSGLACAGVAKAERSAQDGTITASCTSGEAYRVYTEEGKGPAVMAL